MSGQCRHGALMTATEERSLNHWWALHARGQGEGCQPISPPPTFIEAGQIDRSGSEEPVSGLLTATLACSRGWLSEAVRVRIRPQGRCLGPGSTQEALSSCHLGLQEEEGWEGTGRAAQVSDSWCLPISEDVSKPRMMGGGKLEEKEEGGPGSRRCLKRCCPVRE